MLTLSLTPAANSGHTDHTCTLSYICSALGRGGAKGYGPKRQIAYVCGLIANHRFPRPLPTLHRAQVTSEVVSSSRWLRAAVDTWLEDFLPPDAAAALDRHAHRIAAAELDSAAVSLGRLRVVGGRA